jgi:hypothetical protein
MGIEDVFLIFLKKLILKLKKAPLRVYIASLKAFFCAYYTRRDVLFIYFMYFLMNLLLPFLLPVPCLICNSLNLTTPFQLVAHILNLYSFINK